MRSSGRARCHHSPEATSAASCNSATVVAGRQRAWTRSARSGRPGAPSTVRRQYGLRSLPPGRSRRGPQLGGHQQNDLDAAALAEPVAAADRRLGGDLEEQDSQYEGESSGVGDRQQGGQQGQADEVAKDSVEGAPPSEGEIGLEDRGGGDGPVRGPTPNAMEVQPGEGAADRDPGAEEQQVCTGS